MSNEPTKQKVCFVVSPIGDPESQQRIHADWLLKGIIKPTFSAHFGDFRLLRADEISTPGLIDSQVITLLLDAEIVIADMSFQNANVFYEMGIRHMKRLPIIHMFHDGHAIPFDVKPHRAIPFKCVHPDDLIRAMADLKGAVEEVLKPGFEVENPVTRARGVQKLDEHAMPELDVLRGDILELRKGMIAAQAEAGLARITAQGLASPPFMFAGRVPTILGQAGNNGIPSGEFSSVLGSSSERDYAAELDAFVGDGQPIGGSSPMSVALSQRRHDQK